MYNLCSEHMYNADYTVFYQFEKFKCIRVQNAQIRKIYQVQYALE